MLDEFHLERCAIYANPTGSTSPAMILDPHPPVRQDRVRSALTFLSENGHTLPLRTFCPGRHMQRPSRVAFAPHSAAKEPGFPGSSKHLDILAREHYFGGRPVSRRGHEDSFAKDRVQGPEFVPDT